MPGPKWNGERHLLTTGELKMVQPESYWKQIILNILPVCLGSFIFLGLIENYKNESSLKVKILEMYYQPSREIVASCQKSHNQLYLKYPVPSNQLKLTFDELIKMSEEPKSYQSKSHEILLHALTKAFETSQKEVELLEDEVKKCRTKVFRALESLAIATGSFDKFNKLAKQASIDINNVYKERTRMAKENARKITPKDLIRMLRNVTEIDFESLEGRKELKSKIQYISPFLAKHSEIMSKTEEEIYLIDLNFNQQIRLLTSSELSEQFEVGFLGWLF
ncbi:MAG: hypothetical protein AB3N14_20105 [Flavobacteriaceae bacterium]